MNKSGSKPGRNIVHVRSPIHNNKTETNHDYDYHQHQVQRDHSAGNGCSQEVINTMGTSSNGSAGYASRKAKFIQKNSGVKIGANSGAGNSLEAIGSPAEVMGSGGARNQKLVL